MKEIKLTDLALINGHIITMATGHDIAEALVVCGDRIVCVGRTGEIEKLIHTGTRVVDLEGKTVTPGFIESHCHPSMAGNQLLFEVDLQGADSINALIEMIRSRARNLPKGKWIVACGYDEYRLKEKRHPTKWDLDKGSTRHPIFLKRSDTHMSVVNSVALRLANITRTTNDPDGGKIDRVSGTGEPTGLLQEVAQNSIMQLIPPHTMTETKAGILRACHQLGSWGFTSFTDAILTRDNFIAYQELLSEGKLQLRAGLLIPWFSIDGDNGFASELKALGLQARFGNNRLRILGTKLIADGSMGGLTAAMYEPYHGCPENRGLMTISRKELKTAVSEAYRVGLRPCIHAIGDKAIDVVLDTVEDALGKYPKKDSRIRIEHCSLPTPEAIGRIKRLGIIPSSATGFIYHLGLVHLAAVGSERIRRYLPHRTYLEKNILSIGHSDWPATSANIAHQIYGAVNRKTSTGECIGPEQGISVMDAIQLYTINAAYASFEENVKGSLEPGKLADMTVLDRNILQIPKSEIKDIKVEMTIVGGEIIYQRNG